MITTEKLKDIQMSILKALTPDDGDSREKVITKAGFDAFMNNIIKLSLKDDLQRLTGDMEYAESMENVEIRYK